MKLNYKKTFFVGLAFLSISAFWQMYDSLGPEDSDRHVRPVGGDDRHGRHHGA